MSSMLVDVRHNLHLFEQVIKFQMSCLKTTLT